ncbi:uncharacterized protein BDW43DRAFT_302734 [Aspergillus alliaceus]|uniref:uncharacterized protein n=1 Tax=Petromyces alliaceus TaxID=209559 RepID=UPI0012A5183A|nr:uncharacterized protein BDW43DRAFT_302734 [Aspergillus alliaceus]KAB8229951.1 hypothetical protein BDW43DRAFT_302734 [Aspergillus alliaceus]
MAPTHILITGANRGLGLGLVRRLLEQPDQTVIAASRNPENPTSIALAELPRGPGSRLIVIKYDASIERDPFDVAKKLTEKHGINHLDIVIANAGIAKSYPAVKDVHRADILEHVEVNVLSAVSLYQATRDLLHNSTGNPIFAIMGSGAGALGRQPPVPSAVYGASKSMVHWYGVRINSEDAWLNTFVLDPGWVQTDMGNTAAQGWGIESAPDSIDKSCDGMVRVLSTATKEKFGGKVVLYTGEVQAW